MIIDYDKMTIGQLADLSKAARDTCGLEFTSQTGHSGRLEAKWEK